MLELSASAGQWIAVLLMAAALGMDALSLGIGIGMKGVGLRDAVRLSAVIALFHVLMPLGGMVTGQYVSTLLGGVATAAGGALLLLLGGHMVYSSLKGEHAEWMDYRSAAGLFVFALSVSMDSFSVGVSLGLFSGPILITVLMFGLFGGLMSGCGLLLGRRVGRSLGGYGEAFGGAILFAFGLLFLF